MTWIGPITYYAHEETDEDPESEFDAGIEAGLSKELAYHLANSNPLYEVGFEFYVNPDYDRYFITAVDFGKGNRIERELPESPLAIGTETIYKNDKHLQSFLEYYAD